MATDLVPFAPKNLSEAKEVAEILSKTAGCPSALKGKPLDVFMVIMAGKEMGLEAMQSLRGITIIDGKISISAHLMVALVKRDHCCEYFKVDESNERIATCSTKRRGDPSPTTMSYRIEQAQRAGLTRNPVWIKHPDEMLRARCMAALARAVYPDKVFGMYDPDEAQEIVATVQRDEPADITPVSQPEPVVIDAVHEPAQDEDSEMEKLIKSAKNKDDLANIVPVLRAYEGQDKEELRKVYAAKRASL